MAHLAVVTVYQGNGDLTSSQRKPPHVLAISFFLTSFLGLIFHGALGSGSIVTSSSAALSCRVSSAMGAGTNRLLTVLLLILYSKAHAHISPCEKHAWEACYTAHSLHTLEMPLLATLA